MPPIPAVNTPTIRVMNVRRATAVATVLFLALPLAAQSGTTQRLVADAIASRGFAAVLKEISDTGTLYSAAPSEIVEPILAERSRLTDTEREALLAVLLNAHERSDDGSRRALARAMLGRIDRFSDWTLLGILVTAASESGLGPEDAMIDALLSVAERVRRWLEDDDAGRSGSERAAIAVAHAARRLSARGPAAGEVAGRIALAETLRTIGRLSRASRVAEDAREAAQALLAGPEQPTRADVPQSPN